MLSRRFWLAHIAAIAASSPALSGCNRAEGQKMAEIKFDLGKNIVDTAKTSGVPQFSAQDVAGLVSYSVSDVPRSITARFTRPGFEVAWQPVFAFAMSADRDHGPELRVESARMSLNIDDMTDAQAQSVAEATLAQFAKGKWKRWADADWHVLLTGRSSVLDERGAVVTSESGGTGAPDPGYKMTTQEWAALSRSLYYRWSGDNVLATLSINNSPGEDRKPAYRMELEFELLDVSLKRDAENRVQRLKDGDAKGWGSTAEHEANKKKRAEQIKRLIVNATKRGDSVVQP
jgi:hypothetical protein